MLRKEHEYADIATSPHTEDLSRLQTEVYLEHDINSHTSILNVGFCWVVEGTLNKTLLAEALQNVIRQHKLLSCRLVLVNDTVKFVYTHTKQISFISHAVTNFSDQEISSVIEEIERKPFDLLSDELCEFHLLEQGPENHHILAKFHHIITDAWGTHLFESQIVGEYNALLSGKDSTLETSESYFDYCKEQDLYIDSLKFNSDLEYWRDALSSVEGNLFTPIDEGTSRALPNQRSTLALSCPESSDFASWCKENKVTISQYITALLVIQASSLFDKSQIVIGMPVLNRKRKFKRTIGLFANVVPVVFQCNLDDSFIDIVNSVKKTLRSAYRHQKTPFGEIVRYWQSNGNSGLPYDIRLSYELYNVTDEFSEASTRHKILSQHYQNHPLSIYIRHWSSREDIDVNFDFWPKAFEAMEGIEPFKDLFKRFYTDAWQSSDMPCRYFGLINDKQQKLTTLENDTNTTHPYSSNLVSIFEQRVHQCSNSIALSFDKKMLTYEELNVKANRVAHYLIEAGLNKEELVGIKAYRSLELVIGIFGILKAGGAYLPIDPSYPTERIRYITEDAACRIILMGPEVKHEEFDATQVLISTISQSTISQSTSTQSTSNDINPAISIDKNQLAYVLYTSGSTGKPKGVMLEHEGIVNRIAWQQKNYPIQQGDCLLQKTSYAFDVSVWELFWWTFTGAKLHLTKTGEEKSPEALVHNIHTHQITAIHFVPSMLGAFLDYIENTANSAEKLTSIKYVICSGEALTKKHVYRFYQLFSQFDLPAKLINLYGPTEASIDVSYYNCSIEALDNYESVPIGKPVDNTQLHILNQSGQKLPVGMQGELHISGIQLARGYRNNAELNDKTFSIKHSVSNQRLYRTGDLARRLPDGNIEYLGRVDHQVKIRGNRIELGEIETTLRRHPEIKESVVTVDSSNDSPILTGYYIADNPIEHQELSNFIRLTLPSFMLPHFLVYLSQLPLNANGKVNRTALPKPQKTALFENKTTYVAPSEPKETILVAAFEEVLAVSPIGIQDNYFSLGGDSLNVLKIKARTKLQGFDFELVDLFDNPTIQGLKNQLRPVTKTRADAPPIPPFSIIDLETSQIDKEKFSDIFPATELQLGMIYHSLKNPGDAVYHDIFRYSFQLSWNQSAWEKATQQIIERHEALRLSFDIASSTTPLQRIHRSIRSPLKIQACNDLSIEVVESLISNYIDKRRTHHYDWLEAPLFEIGTFVIDQGLELIFSFHHSILDGWSVATVISDLLRCYLILLGKDVPALDDTPTTRMVDYVILEQAAAKDTAHKQFWADYLAKENFCSLQSWSPYFEEENKGEQLQYYAQFSDELQSSLETFCHDNGVAMKHVLLAMHCLTEQLMSGQEEITTGVISNGRPDTLDSDRIAGLFLNTIPLRFNNQNTSWRDAIDQVISEDKKTYAYRRYPMAEMQHALGDHKLFDITFNFVNFTVLADALRLPGVELTNWQPMEYTNFALLVNFGLNPLTERLFVKLDYNTHKISKAQIQLYVRYGSKILEEIIERPNSLIDFECLTQPRPHQTVETKPALASKLAQTATPPDIQRQTLLPAIPVTNDTLVSIFQSAVEKHRDLPAVIKGDSTLSYAELDRSSTQWSHYLQQQGIQVGDRVCILMSRSTELVTALIAILKAGAAYVPLDQTYPVDRLNMIIEDADPSIIITNNDCEPILGELSTNAIILNWESNNKKAETKPTSPLDINININDNAYILFTSGSTGRPKGVAMPHSALANLVLWQLEDMPMTAKQRTLQYSPIGFDVSFQEIFSTLCGGGELVLIEESMRVDLLSLVRLLETYAINRVFMPYIALQHLAEVAIETNTIPTSLQYIITAGEQLKITQHIRQFCSSLPSCRLDNHYGPTEAHVVTRFSLINNPSRWPSLPPIGTAITNAEVLILDASNKPTPPGITGEIVIAGTCLANDYFQRKTLTEEKFFELTISGIDKRYYRTGDIGLVLPSGNIVCLGRADTQVKVRGYRVELGEIEVQLLAYNTIQDCIKSASVIAKQDSNNNTILIAFIEVDDSEQLNIKKVTDYLHRRLPEFMVPSHIQIISKMPVTPNGKINFKALETILLDVPNERIIESPSTDTEISLLHIWKDVLKINEIGVTDNFFDLGGHSLVAVRMVALIEKQLNIATPLSFFVESPTIRAFSEKLEKLSQNDSIFSPCVDFGTAPTSSPLFMVHPIGGNVVCYGGLARSLKGKVNLIALQAPGTSGSSTPLKSIKAFAQYYADAIIDLHPEGPIHIGGWSFGGFVAFELQKELQSRGRNVANTFLLDSIMLRKRKGVEVTNTQLLNWFMWELLAGDWQKGHAVEEVDFSNMDDNDIFEFIRCSAVERDILPASSKADLLRNMYAVFYANWQALLNYHPTTSTHPITLFSATEKLPQVLLDPHKVVESAHDDRLNGWGDLASHVELVSVPGDHLTMMTVPNIDWIGSYIANKVRQHTGPSDKLKH